MCEVAKRMKKSEELKNEHYEFIVDKFFEGEKEKFENASIRKMRDVYDKLCDEEEGRAIAVCNGKEETDEDRIVYDLVTCLGNILDEIHMEKLNAKV